MSLQLEVFACDLSVHVEFSWTARRTAYGQRASSELQCLQLPSSSFPQISALACETLPAPFESVWIPHTGSCQERFQRSVIRIIVECEFCSDPICVVQLVCVVHLHVPFLHAILKPKARRKKSTLVTMPFKCDVGPRI